MSSIKSKDISRTFKDHTVGLGIILKDRQNTTKPQDCSVHTTATFSLCFMLAASGPLWEESALSLGFRIISQNWIAAYLGYTLRLFHVWPVMVHDTHTRRRKKVILVTDVLLQLDHVSGTTYLPVCETRKSAAQNSEENWCKSIHVSDGLQRIVTFLIIVPHKKCYLLTYKASSWNKQADTMLTKQK